jgi:hypothetical protein
MAGEKNLDMGNEADKAQFKRAEGKYNRELLKYS